jgi:O-antigen/teichoic acid export membrane protein
MLAQRIRGDSIAYGASMLLVRVLAFASLAVFARILTPQHIGALNILVMAGLALVAVASMELPQALMRYCAGPREAARTAYYASAFWFVAISSIACALAVSLFSRPASRLLFADEQWSDEIAVYSLCIIANSMFMLLQSLCRSELRRAAFTASTITWAAGSFVFSVLLALASPRPLIGVIAGQALGAISGAAVAATFLGLPSIRDVSGEALRHLLRFSAPLVISVLSVLAATHTNRLLLARWGTLEDVAAFTVASQVANFAALTLIGIQSALGPLVLAHHASAETPRQVADLFGKFWIVTMTVCLLLGIAADPLVALLFPPSYRSSAAWIFPLSLATVLSQSYVFWPGFTVAKWTMGQMLVTVGAGIVAVGINVLAVLQWGVHGAVAGALAGSVVFLVSWILLSNACYRIPVSLLKMLAVSVCAAGMYAAVALHGTLGELTIIPAAKAVAATAVFILIAAATMTGSWRPIPPKDLRRGL